MKTLSREMRAHPARSIHLNTLITHHSQVVSGFHGRVALTRLAQKQEWSDLIIIFDGKVRQFALDLAEFCRNLPGTPRVQILRGPSTESAKTFAQATQLCQGWARRGVGRSSVVVVVGGGCLGDLVGFAAGIYMRGIRWIMVPTTLIAQVDSAIGGKTAVNLAAGKNLLGCFHPPELVWVNSSFLRTLPRRELVSGLAEVIKYGLVLDQSLFRELEGLGLQVLTQPANWWSAVIVRCLGIKARGVQADPLDLQGIRAQLNFGHTVGHALELLGDYRRFKHGEALIYGMQLETELARLSGSLADAPAARIQQFLQWIPVPQLEATSRPILAAALWRAMGRDKKNERRGDRILLRYIQLTRIGRGRLALMERGHLERSLKAWGYD